MSLNCSIITDRLDCCELVDYLSTSSQVATVEIVRIDKIEFFLNDITSYQDLIIFDLQNTDRILDLAERIDRIFPHAYSIVLYNPLSSCSWMLHGMVEDLISFKLSRSNLEGLSEVINFIYIERFVSIRRLNLDVSLDENDLEIIKCLQKGYTDKQIADAISLSSRSVNRKISELLLKFDCENRVAVAVKSVRLLGDLVSTKAASD